MKQNKKKYKNHINKAYTINVARSIDEVEEFRRFWEEMQWHPNADIDFYLTIVSLREEILRPHVIVLSINEVPKTIVVGRIEEQRFEMKFGYKTLFKPKVRLLRIIYGGFLGDVSYANSNIIVSELIDSLNNSEFDVICLDNVCLDSDIYRLAKTKPGYFFRDHFPIKNLHWKASLPASIEEFTQNIRPKHRYWIRRMSRLLERNYHGKITFKYFHNKEEVDQLCNDVEEIAKKTYQRGIGAGFIFNNENYHRMNLSAEKGWLRAYILYISGSPSAFWIGTYYRDTFHLGFTGYDPKYKKFELGTILFMKMVEDLCQNNIKEIDFGFGDALYKRRFGDQKWQEASILIFSPTLKGVTLNFKRTLTILSVQSTKWILNRLNLLEKVKKRWRSYLTLQH